MLVDPAQFEPPPSAPSATQLAAAQHLTLTGVAATPAATALVAHLTALVAPLVDAERDNVRRSAGAAKLSKTVGAAVAGLLRRWGSEEPSLAFRSLSNDGFTGAPVGRRQFIPTMEALVALGLVGHSSGISFTSPGFDGTPGWERRAARYWPTEKLLALALRHGVGRDGLREHFRTEAPTKPPTIRHPVEVLPLRLAYARSAGSLHLSASLADPEAAQLRAGVEAHNAFAATNIVEGCTPPRFRRIFHGAWELHGRWYAPGEGSYQLMPEAERLRLLRIGGERVAEIDAKAAHLTILLALAGQTLSAHEDPYDVPGIPRAVVKAWVTATLGKGSPVRRWSSRAPKACQAFDAGAVGAAIVARYPAMRDPAAGVPDALAERLGGRRSILSHYLMALEAMAVTGAMERLRDTHRVLALPVHDALIVPLSAAGIAEAVFREEFDRVIGVAPGLEVQRAG